MSRPKRTSEVPGREPGTDLPARFLTVSNLLSLSRVLLLIPFVIIMSDPGPEERAWGAVIILLAALTDNLDGLIARRMHQTSEWGKILDPIADKIAVAGVVLTLYVLGAIPVWYLALVGGRDILILAGGLLIKAKRRVTLSSNEIGKWTVGFIGLTLFTLVLWPPSFLSDSLMILSGLMMVLSLVSYGQLAYRVISTEKP